jgi:transposase-like protein
MSTESHSNRATVAANFVAEYGKPRLKRFLKLLQQNASGQDIAREFGVSRERVRQWKNSFGRVVVRFESFADIRRLAGAK